MILIRSNDKKRAQAVTTSGKIHTIEEIWSGVEVLMEMTHDSDEGTREIGDRG